MYGAALGVACVGWSVQPRPLAPKGTPPEPRQIIGRLVLCVKGAELPENGWWVPHTLSPHVISRTWQKSSALRHGRWRSSSPVGDAKSS